MSLINCPNCGESVSDSAKTCPHCGFKLKEEAKNFSTLAEAKRKELTADYCSSGGVLPKDYTDMKSIYKLKMILILWVTMVFDIAPFIIFVCLGFGVDSFFLIGAAVFLCIGGILTILIIKIVKKYKSNLQKLIISRVNMEKWLKDRNIVISWEWGTETQSYLEYKKLKREKGLE